MEEGAVCHRDSQPTEAHAQDHVVWSVIAITSAAAHEKSPDGFPAEDHAGRSRQKQGLEPWSLFNLMENFGLEAERPRTVLTGTLPLTIGEGSFVCCEGKITLRDVYLPSRHFHMYLL